MTTKLTPDQTSILVAIRDALKAVSVLDAYESVVGVPPRNVLWRAVVDLIHEAVKKEQLSPSRITTILHKTGFVDFQVGPHGNISHANQNPNQLAQGPRTPHRW